MAGAEACRGDAGMLSKRSILLSILGTASPRRKAIKGWGWRTGRRGGSVRQTATECHTLLETLEDRLMLTVNPILHPTLPAAHPTFRLLNPQTLAAHSPAASPEQSLSEINPQQMQAAYGVNLISFGSVKGTGQGQTIALIDAYADPNIVGDAQTFSSFYGLPQFNGSGEPTLQVLTETGSSNLSGVPEQAPGGWDVEESLDVEWAHSIAPQANIILYEANSDSIEDLVTADQTAAKTAGVSAVSNSWSTSEFSDETQLDSIFTTPTGHQGVTFTASTGDSGPPAGWPAYSPNVVAVGGTSLDLNSSGSYLAESAWGNLPFDGASSGGISQYEPQPSYQVGKVNSTSSSSRTVPDLSMDADPSTGVPVLDTYYTSGYFDVGGTSLASPMTAALIAIANQGRVINGLTTLNGQTQTLPMLYSLSSTDYHDITTGLTNDAPYAANGYSASFGYDLATGLGSPIGNDFVLALAGDQPSSIAPPNINAPLTDFDITNTGSETALGNITVADALATTSSDTLSLAVSDGTLSLGSTLGLSFISGSNNSSSMTVQGTLANLNAAVSNSELTYTAPADYVGSDFVQISLHDAGDGLTGFATINLTDLLQTSPYVVAGSAVSDPENQSLPIDPGLVVDATATATSDSVTLTVDNGTITLPTTTGLTFESGSNNSSSMTVSGTLQNLNNALFNPANPTGIEYTPETNFVGFDWLQLTLSNANDGLSGSGAMSISVSSSPQVTAPGKTNVEENTPYTYPAGDITLADGSASGFSDTLELQALKGTLTLATTSDLNITEGANDSSFIWVNGTLASLQAAVDGLVYTPGLNFTGSDGLSVDLANATYGTSADVLDSIEVSAAPSVTVPGGVGVNENSNYNFGATISVSDSSAASASQSLSLSVGKGKLALGSTIGLSIASGSNDSSSMTVTGSLGNLNAALNGLTYAPNSGYTGPDSLAVSYTDENDTLTASKSVAITVTANTTPVIDSYSYANAIINGQLPFDAGLGTPGSLITVSDAAGDSAPEQLTLTVLDGTLDFQTTTGLSVMGNGTASVVATGTLASLNNNLGSLVYTPNANYVGPDTLSLSDTNQTSNLTGTASTAIDVLNYQLTTNPVPFDVSGAGLSLLLPNGDILLQVNQIPTQTWDLITPDSSGSYINGTWKEAGPMNVERYEFGSAVLPNGDVFVVGGISDNSYTSTAEIYNPATNAWTLVASDPDTDLVNVPTEVLSNGDVMVGSTDQPEVEIYNPSTNTWTLGAPEIYGSNSQGPWVKLSNGNILAYNPVSSVTDNQGEAELYDTSINGFNESGWINASFGAVPILSNQAEGSSFGPELLLPDGRVFVAGANGQTAFYNSATGVWSSGPMLPTWNFNGAPTQLAMANGPGAVLPNGDVLLALSPIVNGTTATGPAFLYEFNPNTNVFTDVTPPGSFGDQSNVTAYVHMLVLPSGQVLITNLSANPAIYTPLGTANAAWQPTITSLVNNGDGAYTLTGTQLNGLDEGASSGGNAQMAENYPLVRLTDTANGDVYYATTSNWSSVGVATGSELETVDVVLSAALGNDPYSLVVVANGIASNPYTAPAVTGPNSAVVSPSGSITFSSATANPIALSDPPATSGSDTLTLAVGHGTLTLASTNGLTFQNGTANDSSSVSVTGTLANLNAALSGLVYTPASNSPGSDSLGITLVDSGDHLSTSQSIAIQIGTPPVISAPAVVSDNTGGAIELTSGNAISVTDAYGTTEQMTLSVLHGGLNLGTTTGLSVTYNGNGSSVVLTGTVSALNADLPTLYYGVSALTNYVGPDTLTITDTDTANGQTGTDHVAITVNAIPPEVTFPGLIFINPPGTVSFSSANLIAVADPFGTAQDFMITAYHGTFNLGTTTGLTVTGNGTSRLALIGSLSSLNNDLSSLTYAIGSSFGQDDHLIIYDTDTANALTREVGLSILKTAPAVAAPQAATLDEDSNFTFSSGAGNPITLTDVWATATSDTLSLSVNNGNLTLGSTTGLSFQDGTTNNSDDIEVTGTLANLNAALNGLVYVPTPGYSGPDSLDVYLFNAVSVQSDDSPVPITVNVISLPVITAPSTTSVNEGATLTFSGGSLSFTDSQANGTSDSVTLTASDGQITLGSTTGVTVSSGSNGTSSMTVTGTVTNLNAALNGLVYAPNAGFGGTDSLAIVVKDAPENVTVSAGVTISVIALPPHLSAPPSESLNENGKLTFPTGSISLTDVNATGSSDSLTLSVSSGTITLGSVSGLSFTAGSNGSSSMTVKGTLANLTAALNGLVYSPTTGFSGHDSLKVSLSDSLDNQSVSSSIAVAVNPFVTGPATAAVLENGSDTFSSAANDPLAITDGGASANSDSMTLTVLHGKLTLSTISGITVTSGANGSSSMTVKGTLANLNAALNGLVYAPTQFYTGNDTLTVSMADSNDNLSGTTSVAISVALKHILSPGVAIAPVQTAVATPAVGADDEQSPSADQYAGVSAAVEVLYE
jgi:Kelch motif